MKGQVYPRTPVVTIELQLWPQPPKGSEPWFWGGGMLDFHRCRGSEIETVWRAELPSFLTMRSARVKQAKGYGWVLEVRLVHEEAKSLLARHGWHDTVTGRTPEVLVGTSLEGPGLTASRLETP